MLERNQWLAIGLISGFAYILGKDRESFGAESFEAEKINTFSEIENEWKDSSVTIYDEDADEFYGIKEILVQEGDDVLEDGHPYLVLNKDSGDLDSQVFYRDFQTGYDAESFEAEDVEGMKDIWWAYKIDDEDWEDFTRYKRKHKDSGMSDEMDMFMEWVHDKSWENEEDIRYHLRFFDNPKSAQKFIGRTKVIYNDWGEPEDVNFIRVYGKVNNEDLDYALTFPREGVFNPYIPYPLLLGGNIGSEINKRAAESFEAEDSRRQLKKLMEGKSDAEKKRISKMVQIKGLENTIAELMANAEVFAATTFDEDDDSPKINQEDWMPRTDCEICARPFTINRFGQQLIQHYLKESDNGEKAWKSKKNTDGTRRTARNLAGFFLYEYGLDALNQYVLFQDKTGISDKVIELLRLSLVERVIAGDVVNLIEMMDMSDEVDGEPMFGKKFEEDFGSEGN